MKLTRCDVCGKDGPINPFGWVEVQPASGKAIWALNSMQHMASTLHACSLSCVIKWAQDRVDDESLVMVSRPVKV